MNQYVIDYWMRRGGEFGRRMIYSGLFSEQDLLLLMPNNAKKMHGLPMTRANGRRKDTIRKRKMSIMRRPVFSIITDIIEDLIPKKVEDMISCFAPVDHIEMCHRK